MKSSIWIHTHYGPAHMDEFLSCCLLIAAGKDEHGAAFKYRLTRGKDIPKADFVLDMGGGQFDHHHLPGAGKGRCTLHLVAEFLGINLPSEWPVVVGLVDCGTSEQRGRIKPAAWGGHPMIRFFLDRFSTMLDSNNGDHEWLLGAMYEIGMSIIKEGMRFDLAMSEMSKRVPLRYDAADCRNINCYTTTNKYKKLHPFVVTDSRNVGFVCVSLGLDDKFPREWYSKASFKHNGGFMIEMDAKFLR